MQHKILLAAFALFAALTGCQKETPDPEPVILDTPVLTSSDITSSGFKVAWGGVEHASAYAYTLSTADGEVSSNESYAETSVTFSDLAAGTEYHIKVKAISSDEKLYLDSKEAELTVTTAEPEIPRTVFDAPTLAAKLGSGFEAFCTEYSGYEMAGQSADGLFVMGAYAQISEEQHPLTVKVAEDAYGNVGSITAIPDNSDDDKTLYSYCLNNYETLGLGEWLGAKYNVYAEDGTSEGGVFQTVAETLDLVNENDVNTLSVYAIFGIVPGRAYAVPSFEDGRFKFQIMNNFLRLDYSVIYDIIGSDYNAFAEANHIIGFKMSMWGQNYFYIDYALDLMDNAFSCDFNTDSEMSSVTSIVLYGPEDTDEQLEIWKDYASSAETLQIGEFKEAYTSSFGMQVDTFESAADALEYVNTNGRPAGGFDPDVVMVFGNESVSLTITLKSLDLKMEITPAE